MIVVNRTPRPTQSFNPGALFLTQGTAALAQKGFPIGPVVARHLIGDWGDVCQEDAAANARALVEGGRLLSSYTMRGWPKVWVITEADRSSTMVLLPDEY